MKTAKIGIIGGGLMGKEMASAFARWCALEGVTVQPILTAVCDLNPTALKWFERIPSVTQFTSSLEKLLANPEIEIVYVALPHNLHQSAYLKVIESGKDLFAEKPFGIDLEAAQAIADAAETKGSFVRCSSEFPFLPGPQIALDYLAKNDCGKILEIEFGFHHSSDLDPEKTANWKRQSKTCGKIGVMGDLGMHVAHIPLRIGWKPRSVYAQLANAYPKRPDRKGGIAITDTYDNALLHTWVEIDSQAVPMRWEMKRLAPGETNTWYFKIVGTRGGVAYSTKEPKTLRIFRVDGKTQKWETTDLGFQTQFKTITGGIFEPGFPDIMQQMWAAYLEERAGTLDTKFGCATPNEALQSHHVFNAALRSHEQSKVETVPL
ncbi:MAG: Gfo/Idh/MocA family oxidoreductase [Verrucomicrobiota bacterium]